MTYLQRLLMKLRGSCMLKRHLGNRRQGRWLIRIRNLEFNNEKDQLPKAWQWDQIKTPITQINLYKLNKNKKDIGQCWKISMQLFLMESITHPYRQNKLQEITSIIWNQRTQITYCQPETQKQASATLNLTMSLKVTHLPQEVRA